MRRLFLCQAFLLVPDLLRAVAIAIDKPCVNLLV